MTNQLITMTKRNPIPAAVRQYVFERDRFQCQNCGRSSLHDATVKLNIDHIIAVANGGSDDLSNLQTLCDRCNQQKSKHYSLPAPKLSII
jgi:5-methylcytosine-specific restriction enzyme A